MSAPIVLATGGTGGHLFPAQALAGELVARGRRLVLVTDRRAGAYGGALGQLETHYVHAGTPRGRRLDRRLLGLTQIALGLIEARALLRRLRPGAVVGFGGYPSMPTMLAATTMGLPTLIHEQNAVLGWANRILAPRVAAIATSFAETARIEASALPKVVQTGNPIRAAVAALCATSYAPPDAGGPIRLLVLGGSQGARIFSTVVPQSLAALPEDLRRRISVTQQCRAEDIERSWQGFAASGIEAEVSTFFEDLAARLSAAHLVIARAGASTVAELAASGRPAILVPYPFATDDHQFANARRLAEGAGAWLIAQREFTPEALAARLESLLRDSPGLMVAAEKSRTMGRPGAAGALADLVERLAKADGAGSTPAEERAA